MYGTKTVLVAGASGRLGCEVVGELKRRGERVRALGRDPGRMEGVRDLADEVCVVDALRPETLPAAFEGADRVFSCLGASVIPMPRYGGRTFSRVDYPANRNLIQAAARAGVRKFVYVSVFGAERLPDNDFIRGHERVVEELRGSGMEYAVLRPTGFFSSMEEILLIASRGLLPEFRGGTPRTNPIHEADLAELCVDAFDWAPGEERDVGGPDVLSRRQIAQYAWQALGREGRAVRVPVEVLRNAGRLIYPFYPRVGALMTFIAEILIDDFVAPTYGTRHIRDYFNERAAALRLSRQGRPLTSAARPEPVDTGADRL